MSVHYQVSMHEAGEQVRTAEKVFGQYETVELPVQSYVRLPQVRSGMNPELPHLKDSIRARGLINPIDVARMTPEQLEAYVAFVNQTWKTDVDAADYELQQQPDGYYYVVVAGHTRTEAILQLQDEDEADYGYSLVAKVHPISDPKELISLQLDENLHSKPTQEQRAIAVVETYQYGLQQGEWKSKEDFLRQVDGKFSRQVLNDALGFAQLPSEARDFVFSGRLSYNAAVAIGRASDTLREYVAMRMGHEAAPERPQDDEVFDEAYRKETALLIMAILNRSLNGTAAKKYVEGQANLMRSTTAKTRGESDDEVLFTMVTADQQQAEYVKGLEADYRKAKRLMENTSIESVVSVQRLLQQLTGETNPELMAEHRRRAILLSGPALAETVQLAAPPLAH